MNSKTACNGREDRVYCSSLSSVGSCDASQLDSGARRGIARNSDGIFVAINHGDISVLREQEFEKIKTNFKT
jgi:hypothetical protein